MVYLLPRMDKDAEDALYAPFIPIEEGKTSPPSSKQAKVEPSLNERFVRAKSELQFNRDYLTNVLQQEYPKLSNKRNVIDRYLTSLQKAEAIEKALRDDEARGGPMFVKIGFDFSVDHQLKEKLQELWVKFMGNAESPFGASAQQESSPSGGPQGTKRSRDDDDVGEANREHGPQCDYH
ncbi:hypothetical protein BDV96DRAFT_642511 [Lophiotrema nucula]|uniref:Uncharacterized protein n=1 Tax=Lophiotrema nucula TaxID=690887 RepID=A0A6A5ZMN0_9PLEO|nr:hypothetical protein BDV96DRAFT_642511 [Lophiotrema nucula]